LCLFEHVSDFSDVITIVGEGYPRSFIRAFVLILPRIVLSFHHVLIHTP